MGSGADVGVAPLVLLHWAAEEASSVSHKKKLFWFDPGSECGLNPLQFILIRRVTLTFVFHKSIVPVFPGEDIKVSR
jgi:hypothetical protein